MLRLCKGYNFCSETIGKRSKSGEIIKKTLEKSAFRILKFNTK